MNLLHLVQDFNPGKFVVHLSILSFTILLSLRLDGYIKCSYWAIFTPLWVWKALVFLGAGSGIVAWIRRPINATEAELHIHFKSMLVTSSLHLFLICFEVLACDKMQSGIRHLWIFVFLPLFLLSVVCIGVALWALKFERPFEMELFFAANLLQLIFLPLKLDGFITWKWELIFIPLWIIFGISVLGLCYSVMLAAVFSRSTNIGADQRQASANAAWSYAALVIPSLVSTILLAKKLDDDINLPFSFAVVPLLMAITSLVLRSFSARGGNVWWFGMRKDFFLFLLDLVPWMREYGNVSYEQPGDRVQTLEENPEATVLAPSDRLPGLCKTKMKGSAKGDNRTVVPILAIDFPD
nr:EOG090X087A [Moina brachiata]